MFLCRVPKTTRIPTFVCRHSRAGGNPEVWNDGDLWIFLKTGGLDSRLRGNDETGVFYFNLL